MLVTIEDVKVIMGIPCVRVDITLPQRRHMESIDYNMSNL